MRCFGAFALSFLLDLKTKAATLSSQMSQIVHHLLLIKQVHSVFNETVFLPTAMRKLAGYCATETSTRHYISPVKRQGRVYIDSPFSFMDLSAKKGPLVINSMLIFA